MTIERLSADDRLLLLSDKVWPQDVGVVVILDGGHLLDEEGRGRSMRYSSGSMYQ